MNKPCLHRLVWLLLIVAALLVACADTTDTAADDDDAAPSPANDDDDDNDDNDDDNDDNDDDDIVVPDDLDATPQTIDAALVRLLETVRQLAHFPGMAAAVVKEGRVVWSHGFGVTNLETQRPVTPDTLFLTGSISKTVLTTALMQLWEQGLFELGDDVADYVPFALENPLYRRFPITFRELMTHTSSIADNGPVLRSLYSDGDSPLPLEEFLADYLVPDGEYFAASNFYDFPPQSRWKYSNVAAAVAGLVVEQLSGEDFAEYCHAHVLQPLGLGGSSYRLADLSPADVAMPYEYNQRTEQNEPFGHYGLPFYPGGTLRTSAVGLARILAMMAGDGELDGQRLLAPGTVAEIREVQYPDRWPSQGLFWYYGLYNDREVFGHQGGGDGVAAKMFYRPDDGVGVVLLANGSWGNLLERLVVEEAIIALFGAADELGRAPWREIEDQ